MKFFGQVAQSVEQRPEKPCVASSILALSTLLLSCLTSRVGSSKHFFILAVSTNNSLPCAGGVSGVQPVFARIRTHLKTTATEHLLSLVSGGNTQFFICFLPHRTGIYLDYGEESIPLFCSPYITKESSCCIDYSH